ncbi:hypothetical protein Tco_0860552 [Tanacetum coccineum]|uniref:Uncharacterized protein n=1 Tax=Tanacetum coccineum TaxID=301880 RepID=A0ABQ5BF94_9ASTR
MKYSEHKKGKGYKESARRITEMVVWIKKLQENPDINTRNQNASLKNLETQIEKLTKELHSRNIKSKQEKEENTNDQLPTKESNPGHFTLPCTIGIEQLIDEYEIKIREKGQILKEIWAKYKRARCKNKDWWYDYWYEDEEKMELGNKDYNPPKVHTETFEVTKYKFDNGCSLICVSGENNETLSLGRKNGSRFRKIIMEEMEEVHMNDGEDSNDGMT